MKYYLMHQNIPVAEVSARKQLMKIINPEEMPIGTMGMNHTLTSRLFDNWKTCRIIPNNRQNIQSIVTALKTTPTNAFLHSLGVSLTDCYWFKDEFSPLTWKDVNFHDNGFAEDIANVSLLNTEQVNNFHSPDLTTNGCLKKGWKSIDGIPTLIKFGTQNNIECANEIVVSKIADLLQIPHVQYTMIQIQNEKICACPSIIQDSYHEMYFLQQVEHLKPKYIRSMQYFKETNTYHQFQEYLFLAALVNNGDMHQQNVAFIRDLQTKEIQLAPLYDFGDSLHEKHIELKPFQWSRQKTFQNIDVDFQIHNDIFPILQDTYEIFQIPEQQYQEAKRVLQDGMLLYQETQLNKAKDDYNYDR